MGQIYSGIGKVDKSNVVGLRGGIPHTGSRHICERSNEYGKYSHKDERKK
jgi:hypothetical protein